MVSGKCSIHENDNPRDEGLKEPPRSADHPSTEGNKSCGNLCGRGEDNNSNISGRTGAIAEDIKEKSIQKRVVVYTPEVCEKLVRYFHYPKQKIVYDVEKFQSGELKRKKPVPLEPEYPTFDRFARQIGVTVPTLYEWEKQYPEFAEACTAARETQKSCVIVNALNRNFDAGFSKFLLCAKFPEEFADRQDSFEGGLDIHITYGKESED